MNYNTIINALKMSNIAKLKSGILMGCFQIQH
jgi:hypothetical protein